MAGFTRGNLLTWGLSGSPAEIPAGAEVQKHCDAVKSAVEKHLKKTFKVFEAKSCKIQQVSGRNFFVKVHVGNNECVHVRIYQNWSQELEMSGVQEGKNLEDPIEFVDRTDELGLTGIGWHLIFESSEGRIYKTPSGNIVEVRIVRNGDAYN